MSKIREGNNVTGVFGAAVEQRTEGQAGQLLSGVGHPGGEGSSRHARSEVKVATRSRLRSEGCHAASIPLTRPPYASKPVPGSYVARPLEPGMM